MSNFCRVASLIIAFIFSSTSLIGQIQTAGAEVLLPADIEGYVRDGGGAPISGATVGILDGMSTLSDASGYYQLSPDLSTSGYVDMYSWMQGYNYEYFPSVWAIPGNVTYQDIVLTAPTMYISPSYHQYTLNPGEYFTTMTGMLNTGDGDLCWTAEVVYPSGGTANNNLFECSPASVYGNPPLGYTNTYLSHEDSTYQQYQELSGITANWNTVSFWGTMAEVIPSWSTAFTIELYGPGSSPGSLLATYSADIMSIPTAEFLHGYPVYLFEATIEEQAPSDCWIKIASTEPSNTFLWLNAPLGTGGAQTWQGSSQIGSHEPLAICLTNEYEGWCTLDWYGSILPGFGLIENIPTNFDASGMTAGGIYNCDIVFTSQPNYDTYTVPVEMTVEGDSLVAVTNLQAVIIDDVFGYVEVSWDWEADAFQFFLVKRDGYAIGTATTTHFIDSPPHHGTYCYTVQAYYDEGFSYPVSSCVEWPAPEINIVPDSHYYAVYPGNIHQYVLNISNTGLGSLDFAFPSPYNNQLSCPHYVMMSDDYGDGWNGATMDVFVDGVMVLSSVTLGSGAGPQYESFQANTGQEITTIFYCGGWCYECYYEIIDGHGNVIAMDGTNGTDPTGIPTGTCYADCPITSYIVGINPNTGVVPAGSSVDVTISWDATGFPTGIYPEDLICYSNDTACPEFVVKNTMEVLTPGFVSGNLYSPGDINYFPINGAKVHSSISETRSFEDGSYTLMAPPGSFDLLIDKPGYDSVTVSLNAIVGDTIYFSDTLDIIPQQPPWVHATVNYPDEDFCAVDWFMPAGPEEIIYDDGEAEDYFAWPNAYNESAVRFTPSGYPCFLNAVSIWVGDDRFGSGWFGSEIAVLVYDEDQGGMPGNLIDSVVISISNYKWVEVTGLDDSISEGDIFISVMQLSPMPNTPPIGIDLTSPLENRSYIRPAGGNWSISTTQDFMIRAVFDQPSTLLDVDYYTVYRVSDFDPLAGPENGTLTTIANTTSFFYIDNMIQAIPAGWYAYGVQAYYPNGSSSALAYSNTVGANMNNTVTFIVSDCLLGPDEGFEITAVGQEWPFDEFIGITDTNGICVFDFISTGNWEYIITKCGYHDYEFSAYVDQDITYQIIVNNILYKPHKLSVDSVSGIASWESPLILALFEDFDEADIYSNGWQTSSNGTGWIQTDDGGSTGFFIPSTGSTYMSTNDAAAGVGNDGCCDMLITPELDLCESDNYMLSFDSYFTGVLGQTASVEYSLDTGQTWTILYTLSPAAGVWEHIDISLAAFSGANADESISFAFHADDGGGHASGWAIDNVMIHADTLEPIDYFTYLDGVYITSTDTNFFQYPNLVYGQTYYACVAAEYDCGLSEEACVIFTAGYLPSPSWLLGDSNNMNVELMWYMDTANLSSDLIGYNIYRDSVIVDYVEFPGTDTMYYIDDSLDAECYDYHVSAVYDLALNGFPGDTGESMLTGPETVCLVYGSMLPLFQDWTSGTFEPDWIPGDNWVMNMQNGNAEPSAEFTWDPILNDYEECLVSGPINGVYPETKSDPYSDGQFMLRFDVKLDNVNPTGNEYFKAEVWSNGEWNTVSEFSNANGSFEWETVEVDISEHAMGYVFKIRFMAVGEESLDILSWFVDNIEVFHYCAPPENVYAGDNGYEIEVNWDIPLSSKHYNSNLLDHTGNIRSSIGDGLTGYNVFLNIDGAGYELIDFTADTFYIYEPPSFGLYCFYVTSVYDACESLMSNESCVTIPYWGLYESDRDNTILIYPNPTDDRINIESDSPFSRLELIDLSGHTLMIQETVHQRQATMNVSSLAPGVYLLRIYTDEGSLVRKIVIE